MVGFADANGNDMKENAEAGWCSGVEGLHEE